MSHTVSITLRGGFVLDTWDEFDLDLDMLAPGSAWTLSLWWSTARQSTWERLQSRALEGEQLYVSIDGAPQLVGTIDHREDIGEHDQLGMVISGRDLAGLALDADADPAIQLRGATLEEGLQRLFEPLSLRLFIVDAAAAREVQSRVAPGHRATRLRGASRRRVVDTFRINPGEKIWTVADGICRKLGYLLWTAPHYDPDSTDGAGIGVVVDAPLDAGEPAYRFNRLEMPGGKYRGNVITARHKISGRGVPTRVTAFGHTQLSAGQDTRQRAVVENTFARDEWSVADPLPRPRYLHATDAHTIEAARAHAQRELARANAGRREYSCTVRDYDQVLNGLRRLYAMNSLAAVQDDFLGISEFMLVTAVRFHRSRKRGELATVRMAPRGQIVVVPAS